MGISREGEREFFIVFERSWLDTVNNRDESRSENVPIQGGELCFDTAS